MIDYNDYNYLLADAKYEEYHGTVLYEARLKNDTLRREDRYPLNVYAEANRVVGEMGITS